MSRAASFRPGAALAGAAGRVAVVGATGLLLARGSVPGLVDSLLLGSPVVGAAADALPHRRVRSSPGAARRAAVLGVAAVIPGVLLAAPEMRLCAVFIVWVMLGAVLPACAIFGLACRARP